MDFDLTDEQRLLQRTIARLASSGATPERHNEDAGELRRSIWKRLADAGLLGLCISERNGGFGGSAVDVMVVMEGMGRELVAEPYVEAIILAGGLLETAGSDCQRQKFLPKLMAGDLIFAFAHYEPGLRGSISSVATRARREQGGYILNGYKDHVVCGSSANKFMVSARTSGHEGDTGGITLFLVDRVQQGIAVHSSTSIDGRPEADVAFTEVRLESEAVIGPVDGAFPFIEGAVDRAVAAVCAEAVGSWGGSMRSLSII